jgi:hypothetical protein
MPDHPLTYDWRAMVRDRLRAAKLHPQDEAELVEEMAQHLEEQFRDLAASVGAEAAHERLAAQLRDQSLDEAVARRRRRAAPSRARAWSSASIWRDVRYGFRSLRRSPGVLAAGTAALALGIGLTTMMFSVVYGTLIKGLPFDDRRGSRTSRTPTRSTGCSTAVRHKATSSDSRRDSDPSSASVVSTAHRHDHRRRSARSNRDRANDCRRIRCARGPSHARPRVRRQRQPAGRRADRHSRILDLARSICVGFLRDRSSDSRKWKILYGHRRDVGEVPVSRPRTDMAPASTQSLTRPEQGQPLNIVGRLRPGVDYASANAEFRGLMKQLDAERAKPATERPVVLPYVRATLPKRVYTLLYSMLAAVMLVLLVACANVTNLLLDRTLGAAARSEFAPRSARHGFPWCVSPSSNPRSSLRSRRLSERCWPTSASSCSTARLGNRSAGSGWTFDCTPPS